MTHLDALLAQLDAIVTDHFVGGTRVINCLQHSNLPITDRPDKCDLCLTDLRNHMNFAVRVNACLNERNDHFVNAYPQLREALASLRRDAERYHVKRDMDAGKFVKTAAYISCPPRERDAMLSAWWKSYNAALDAVIDRARSEG